MWFKNHIDTHLSKHALIDKLNAYFQDCSNWCSKTDGCKTWTRNIQTCYLKRKKTSSRNLSGWTFGTCSRSSCSGVTKGLAVAVTITEKNLDTVRRKKIVNIKMSFNCQKKDQ